MSNNDSDPPVAADDFPEFSEPPRLRPDPSHDAAPDTAEPASAEDTAQGQVDDVLARLRREREEGKR
jgi:hypothetical protein